MSCRVKTKDAIAPLRRQALLGRPPCARAKVAALCSRLPPRRAFGLAWLVVGRVRTLQEDGGVRRERELSRHRPRSLGGSGGGPDPGGGGSPHRRGSRGPRHHPLVAERDRLLLRGPPGRQPPLLRGAQARKRGPLPPPLPATPPPAPAGEAPPPLRDQGPLGDPRGAARPGLAGSLLRLGRDRSLPLRSLHPVGCARARQQRGPRLLAGLPLLRRTRSGSEVGLGRPSDPVGSRGPGPPLARSSRCLEEQLRTELLQGSKLNRAAGARPGSIPAERPRPRRQGEGRELRRSARRRRCLRRW